MEENKRQHLEFIQNVITRMNTNSFQIKGLAITIVSALMAIYASTKNVYFIFLGIPATLLFWFLDSYYLQQERKFTGVYNDVTGLQAKIKVKPYEMPIQKYTKKINKRFSFWNVFVSRTIIWLYLSVVISLLVIGAFQVKNIGQIEGNKPENFEKYYHENKELKDSIELFGQDNLDEVTIINKLIY